jgi:hypothetical protein
LLISIKKSYNIIVLFHQREESEPEDIKETKEIIKVIKEAKVINQEQEDIIKK